MCEAWKWRRGVAEGAERDGWTVMSVLPDRAAVMRSLRAFASPCGYREAWMEEEDEWRVVVEPWTRVARMEPLWVRRVEW